jgi:hypothetical protein
MDRYFRRVMMDTKRMDVIFVSIHLLWTGTLEARKPLISYTLRECFNPSFMDRYFRS